MKRKTPIKHRVKQHKHNNKLVNSYIRGNGGSPQLKLANPKIKMHINQDFCDNATPDLIVTWATNKYGTNAFYMLKETGEGREVFGNERTNQAIKILERINKITKLTIKINRLGHGGSRMSVEGLTEDELQIAKQAEKKGTSPQFEKLYNTRIALGLKKIDQQSFSESSFWVKDNTLIFDTGD